MAKGNTLSMRSGVKLETGFSPTFPSPGGSTVSRGPDTLGSRAEGIPQGAGQSTWFNWPREPFPPLDCSPTRTKPERTLDPCVWGGSWLSPQPFDWAAVMGERQLGGRGRKGAATIAYTAVTPHPQPLQPGWQEARFRRSRHLVWGRGLRSKTEGLRSEAWSDGMFLPGSSVDQRGLGTLRGELEVSVA
jgi:hypothetical protein